MDELEYKFYTRLLYCVTIFCVSIVIGITAYHITDRVRPNRVEPMSQVIP